MVVMKLMKRNVRINYLIVSYTLSAALLISAGLMIYSFYLSSMYANIQESSLKLKQFYERYTAIKYTFLYTGDLKLKEELKRYCHKCKALQKEYLHEEYSYKPQAVDVMDRRLFALMTLLEEYKERLEEIFELKKQLGVDHKQGLYRTLRVSIHKVEREFLRHQGGIELSYYMLKLRRHEKDFMLRGLKKYIDDFDDDYNRLVELIEDTNITNKTKLKYNLLNYHREFHSFCDIYRQLFKKGGIISQTQTLEEQFNRTYNTFLHDINKTQHPITTTMKYAILSALLLLIGLIVTLLWMRGEIKYAKEINPLTQLNGNNRINKYLHHLLKHHKDRMIIYFDFDNFKPFNDHFGFEKGDEVILFFSKLLKEVFGQKGYFIGHIGGDDFIVMIENAHFDKVVEEIQAIQKDFVEHTQTFYDDEAKQKGKIFMKDRFGVEREFEILGVSAASIHIRQDLIIMDEQSIGELIAVLKKSAKITKLSVASIL